MDCAKSLELLSEYRDDTLDAGKRADVSEHVSSCAPCAAVLHDINEIVTHASVLLRAEADIAYPDENAVWRRMNIGHDTVH